MGAHKRVVIAAVAVVIAGLTMRPARLLAADNSGLAGHVVISELQIGSTSSSSQEFVELYNPTDESMSVDGWKLEYASSSGTSWSPKATLSGEVASHGFYLVSTAGYLDGDAIMKSGLALTGGHVRLIDADAVVDLVGWGSAIHAEGTPVDAPVSGGSIERLPGHAKEDGGNGQDSKDNAADFAVRSVAQPQNSLSSLEDPATDMYTVADASEVVNDPGTSQPPPDPSVEDIVEQILPLVITELLPDPASPLSDAADEYIELYNPNNVVVNLAGYQLRAGSDFRDSYTIPEGSVEPGGYVALYALQTKLSLTNSGGAAELLDPLGNVVSVTERYGPAKTGYAWAAFGGSWQWTDEATPAAANVLSQPASASSASSTKTTAKSASKTTKKTTAKTSKTTKAAKTKAVSKQSTTTMGQAIGQPSKATTWLLIGLACFTIGYAIYGFRNDLYNYYIRTRRYLGTWLEGRRAVSRRRNI